mmetsp:Transcript_85141/g.177928  ORF Transcript_85141/g.177928 Transcript_85141/m.177928 type:complete len:109 (-) Transcript_85141:213-539(-)
MEDIHKAWAGLTGEVCWLLLCTCISATALNLLGMFTIKELGASSMQIVGKLNTIILCAFSVSFMGERLPAAVIFGASIILVGIGFFEHTMNEERSKLDSMGKLPMTKR